MNQSPALSVTVASPAGMPKLGELPQTLTLDVTRLDLYFGVRESGNLCALACAFKRALRTVGVDVLTVDVMEHTASVMLRGAAPGQWTEYRHNGSDLVKAFDRNERVQPCTVTLRRTS